MKPPNITTYELRAYEEVVSCPECAAPLTASPSGLDQSGVTTWDHLCTPCDYRVSLNARFPRVVWKRLSTE